MGLESFPKPNTEKSEESSHIEKPGYVPEMSPEEINQKLKQQEAVKKMIGAGSLNNPELVRKMAGGRENAYEKGNEDFQKAQKEYLEVREGYKKLLSAHPEDPSLQNILSKMPRSYEIANDLQNQAQKEISQEYKIKQVFIGGGSLSDVPQFAPEGFNAKEYARNFFVKKLGEKLSAEDFEKLKKISEAQFLFD